MSVARYFKFQWRPLCGHRDSTTRELRRVRHRLSTSGHPLDRYSKADVSSEKGYAMGRICSRRSFLVVLLRPLLIGG